MKDVSLGALLERMGLPRENLLACGDGAGITRGLSQASASGVHVARQIGERARSGK